MFQHHHMLHQNRRIAANPKPMIARVHRIMPKRRMTSAAVHRRWRRGCLGVEFEATAARPSGAPAAHGGATLSSGRQAQPTPSHTVRYSAHAGEPAAGEPAARVHRCWRSIASPSVSPGADVRKSRCGWGTSRAFAGRAWNFATKCISCVTGRSARSSSQLACGIAGGNNAPETAQCTVQSLTATSAPGLATVAHLGGVSRGDERLGHSFCTLSRILLRPVGSGASPPLQSCAPTMRRSEGAALQLKRARRAVGYRGGAICAGTELGRQPKLVHAYPNFEAASRCTLMPARTNMVQCLSTLHHEEMQDLVTVQRTAAH